MNVLEDNTKIIDHINHQKNDNRKCNLRFCTNAQNMMNRKAKGCYFDQISGKFRPYIFINGKIKQLGYFDNLEEAIKIRKEAEIMYYGEYRYND
jgi:hypothetical protein